jgi:hypothetical protein
MVRDRKKIGVARSIRVSIGVERLGDGVMTNTPSVGAPWAAGGDDLNNA